MKLIQNTVDFQLEEGTAVAIGKFDGIHLGHKELFKTVLKAKDVGLKAAVFTFDPSPGEYFAREKGKAIPKELTTKEEKRRLFEKMGIDYLVEYPFNHESAAVSPETYIEEFLIKRMHARIVVAGEDLSFGKDGKGNAELLKHMGDRNQVTIKIISKICKYKREISSSYVREEIEKGNIEAANELLGEPYFIEGNIMSGNKIGRTIGLPTINLYPASEKLLPPNGVYFSTVQLGETLLYGVTNIGKKPTIEGENPMSVETYLFDFSEEIYGKFVRVNLLKFDREEKKFTDISMLQQAILDNITRAKSFFGI